jgi:two-component system CitB family sensor kinase
MVHPMRRRRPRFTTQLLLLQVGVIVVVVTMGFALFGFLLDRQLGTEFGFRALAVARSFAEDNDLRTQVAELSADHDPATESAAALAVGPVQAQAEAIRIRTAALFVVVTDDRGIRLAHPEPSRLGEPVSTDPSVALGGDEEVVEQRGTLGDSARAKVPVFAPGSDVVVGVVSVGISTDEIDRTLWEDLKVAALYAIAAIALGVIASVLLNRRLRRLTLGVEPEELAGMASEHEAVLGGIGEAVLAVNPAGRVTVANDEARQLFGVDVKPGDAIEAIGLPPPLLTLMTRASTDGPAAPALILAGQRILVCTARAVIRNRRDLGVVVSARDRTDVEFLTRQLDAVQTMGSALRAQRHEFANRLHVIHGLLAQGDIAEAAGFVQTVLGSGPLATPLDGIESVADPTLQAFLSAKAANAREMFVDLRLGPETWLPSPVIDSVALVTVLGNLLDNAFEAASQGRQPRWVEVEILQDVDTLFLTVADSGAGVPESMRESIFLENVSRHQNPPGNPGLGRGLGLALVRQVARAVDGEVWLADPGGERTGAIFVARLPGIIPETPRPPVAAQAGRHR